MGRETFSRCEGVGRFFFARQQKRWQRRFAVQQLFIWNMLAIFFTKFPSCSQYPPSLNATPAPRSGLRERSPAPRPTEKAPAAAKTRRHGRDMAFGGVESE